jgi:hypothetical protein
MCTLPVKNIINRITVTKSKKNLKVSKGYRLKPATHKLIRTIQELMGSNQDEVIGKACRFFYEEITKNINNKRNLKNSN